MPEMTMAEMKDDIERRGALEGAEVLARLHPVAPENHSDSADASGSLSHSTSSTVAAAEGSSLGFSISLRP